MEQAAMKHNNFNEKLNDLIELSIECKNDEQLCAEAEYAASLLVEIVKNGGTIYTAGNGGSAAQAQHFSAELVGRYLQERSSISSVCLNTDTSTITAIANDYHYSMIFSRQLQGIAQEKDALVVFSTSGRSENILNAAEEGRRKSMLTIAITGEMYGDRFPSNIHITVPSTHTPLIQVMQMHIMHYICEFIEGEMA